MENIQNTKSLDIRPTSVRKYFSLHAVFSFDLNQDHFLCNNRRTIRFIDFLLKVENVQKHFSS